jgi:hypothetical protein
VKVGDLIGLPMLDDNDVTLGRVQRVVRSPEGKSLLRVPCARPRYRRAAEKRDEFASFDHQQVPTLLGGYSRVVRS